MAVDSDYVTDRAAGSRQTVTGQQPEQDLNSPREECGVFGVWAPGEDVAKLTYYGLYALQHRGQEAAGIAVADGSQVLVFKDLGLGSGWRSTPRRGRGRQGQESGVPYGQGLMKNAYVGRTFIQPSQTIRQLGIRLKLNPLKEVIRGKRLIVVDDSIVRGNTQRALVRMLREAGEGKSIP